MCLLRRYYYRIRGCSFLLQWVYLDIFITVVFNPNDVIDTECVDRRCSVISLYPHIEVVITCTRGFVKDVIFTECGDRRRCSVVSLYPHIEVNISCPRGFVKDVIATECVDRGRRCLVVSLYLHINIVITNNPRQCP